MPLRNYTLTTTLDYGITYLYTTRTTNLPPRPPSLPPESNTNRGNSWKKHEESEDKKPHFLYTRLILDLMRPLVNHWSLLTHASHCMTTSWPAAATQTQPSATLLLSGLQDWLRIALPEARFNDKLQLKQNMSVEQNPRVPRSTVVEADDPATSCYYVTFVLVTVNLCVWLISLFYMINLGTLSVSPKDDSFKTPIRPGGKTTLSRKKNAVVGLHFSFTFIIVWHSQQCCLCSQLYSSICLNSNNWLVIRLEHQSY